MSSFRYATRLAVLFTATIVLTASCAPSPEPMLPVGEDGPTLRVMTYNLLGAQADATLYSEHAGWAARVDQLNPDVIVLQEAQSDDVSAVRDLTSTGYTLAAYVQWDCDIKPEREGVAILVRSTIPVRNGGGENVGASCVAPSIRRVLVWAEIELEGGPLRVYGTHLSQGGAAYDASRDAQIRRIKERINADDEAGDRRFVLAGDVNTSPGDDSYRLLTGDVASEAGPYRFVDTFAELEPDAVDPSVCPAYSSTDVAAQQRLLADPALVRRCGYTAGWPKDDNLVGCDLLSLCESWMQRRDLSVRVRIDDVFRAEGGPIDAVAAQVPNRTDPDWAAPGAEWYRLSDHLPYIVDLDVSGRIARAAR